MATFDRMVKLSIELSEFGIEFKSRKSIQAQPLMDFVAECTFSTDNNPIQLTPPEISWPQMPFTIPTDDTWMKYIDGSSAQKKGSAKFTYLAHRMRNFVV